MPRAAPARDRILIRRVLAAATVVAAFIAARPALAEVKRYALLVGANQGRTHEVPLRYAETDVRAVAETLSQVGGFASERVVRLVGASADRVRTALLDLNLTIQSEVRAGHEAVLFVYYSGHADSRALHLGGTDLASEDLSKLVRLSPAKLKILLVDACRSGALTRVKGGRQVAPFQIGVEDKLRNEGYAVITSSSAGEDAQESDALRSSIFTHHFLAALRGPGDVNRDRQVTLGEAYGYAYEQALKTSMGSVVGSQHATFDYDLRGRADPVLADLRAAGTEQGQLLLATVGEYLVVSEETGAVLLEAAVKTPRTAVLLPAARYQIRLRTRTNVYQGEVALAAGQERVVGGDDLKPLPLAQVVRKGDTDARLAQGPTLTGSMHGPLGSGFSPMLGAQLGYAFELPRLTLMPRVGWATGRSGARAENVTSFEVTETSVELAALYVFDVKGVSLAPMLSVGWGFFSQTVDRGPSCFDAQCRFTTRPQGLITTVGGWGSLPLGRGFTLEASLELANFYLRRQEERQGIDQNAPRFGTLTYRAGLGVGYRY